jgi:hypothetical protein
MAGRLCRSRHWKTYDVSDYPQLYTNTEIDYPNATGETLAAEEALLLDETSVLLWMAYSYQKRSGNTEWVRPYLPTLQKYADYLVQNGLYLPSQWPPVDSIEATVN